MNGKVLMLAIIFLGGFHVFYAFNRVQNFANIMYRLCAIQLGECPILGMRQLLLLAQFIREHSIFSGVLTKAVASY